MPSMKIIFKDKKKKKQREIGFLASMIKQSGSLLLFCYFFHCFVVDYSSLIHNKWYG